MLRPIINHNICQECFPCQALKACKTRAIIQIDPDDFIYVEYPRCSGCGTCVEQCCCEAISLGEIS